ncbi:LysM peptidoglycan-binding domain-containing protein [Vagococcus sp. BWB3-3]|uniref:LysM peptidoglycan-binding domain-containing protein n=1 Tax=Vagococcus allomyrinae TaxID=2794353 RepID=A0A940P8X9_9ENTE|nr:LysM peptidoglycan-binding domain-containing protein [Vagococcus allomyrinae]MBP1043235.1 LysM peptidoglycan-binding domain-containing protein [Vagococcus allomyrinae]
MTTKKWGILSLTHYYRVVSTQGNQEERVVALDRLSLSQPFGEIVGLIGGKGAGKQTFIRILMGEITPSEGLVSGRPDTMGSLELPEQRSKERTGESYTKRKLLKWQMSKKKIAELTKDIHEFSELGEQFFKKIKYYTQEEQIQLEVSILLHVAPSLIYIDESLLTVKEHFYIKVFFYLLNLKELGSSIWINTANINRVESYCDKLIWLEFGRLQEHGEVKDVLKRYEDYYQQITNLSYKEQKNFWKEGYEKQLIESRTRDREKKLANLKYVESELPEVGEELLEGLGDEDRLSRSDARRQKRQQKPLIKKWWGIAGVIVLLTMVASALLLEKLPTFKGRTQKELPKTNRIERTSQEPIPASSSSSEKSVTEESPSESVEQDPDVYVVKAGDSLSKIAEQFGLSLQQLKDWNHLTSDYLMLDQRLNLRAPAEALAEVVTDVKVAAASFTHVVVTGDTLLGIAEKYGVSIADLQAVNQLAEVTIYSGTELMLPADARAPIANSANEPASQVVASVPDQSIVQSELREHIVSSGETLYGIARRYGVDIMEMQRINFLQTEQLYPGQQLRIP